MIFLRSLIFFAFFAQIVLTNQAPTKVFEKDEMTAMLVQYKLNMKLIESFSSQTRKQFKLGNMIRALNELAAVVFDSKVLLRFCGKVNKHRSFNEYLVNVYQVENACPWCDVAVFNQLNSNVFKSQLPSVITSKTLLQVETELQYLVANGTRIFKPWIMSQRALIRKLESYLDKYVVAEVQKILLGEINRQTGVPFSELYPVSAKISCNVLNLVPRWRYLHAAKDAFAVYNVLPIMKFKLSETANASDNS